MSQTLKTRLADDIKTAMRARDSERLGTLRFLQAAVKQREVDERTELGDAEITAIIEKQVKQRRESIQAFEQAGRTESADKEKAELLVLQQYLPQQAQAAEIDAIITAAIAQAQADGTQGPALMGKVMGQVKAQLAGRADMSAVSVQVKQMLNP
ncbi:MAG TPA: GatB/YqeY domain-containing protein [Alcaligenes sp.]|nr:GatB/YqeY domain-containing protein [Alcaligenes sp.]HRL27049.1 GatB/YqeY domain-containing protein [Alcaligenes sp.]